MNDELKISVSGIRGKYPDSINPEIVYKFGLAYGKFLKEKKVYVGRDTRLSGEVLLYSLISSLLITGKDVFLTGISPTPLIEFIVEKDRKAGGVIITASHNPSQYNGIKFLSSKGTFLNERENKKLMEIYKNEKFEIKEEPGKVFTCDKTTEFFEEIYKNVNKKEIEKSKFKVVIDVCQGVGALFTKSFLEGLGCDVKILNEKPYGVFSHDPEPKRETLKQLSFNVKKFMADIGFAQDPDGDRLAMVDEKGQIIGEEMVLALSVTNILEKKKGPVVVNLSTSSIIDDIAGKFNAKVYRTKIGEVNVVEKMKRVKSVIGGEGNGGVIFPSVHYGRDSFVGMALILEYMATKGKKISEILKDFPEYFMVKKKIPISSKKIPVLMEKLKETYRKERLNLLDGVKIIRKDGWIHIRASGTEPVLRLIIETKDREKLRLYLEEFENFCKSYDFPQK